MPASSSGHHRRCHAADVLLLLRPSAIAAAVIAFVLSMPALCYRPALDPKPEPKPPETPKTPNRKPLTPNLGPKASSPSCTASEPKGPIIGDLVIRIGFWGPLDYNAHKEPSK